SYCVLLGAGFLGLVAMFGMGMQWSGDIAGYLGFVLVGAFAAFVCFKQAQPFFPLWFAPAILFTAPTAIWSIAMLSLTLDGAEILVTAPLVYLFAGAIGGFIKFSHRNVGA